MTLVKISTLANIGTDHPSHHSFMVKGMVMRDTNGDAPGQSSWGFQVVVILICGLLLATLGWFAADEFGDTIQQPLAATSAQPGD